MSIISTRGMLVNQLLPVPPTPDVKEIPLTTSAFNHPMFLIRYPYIAHYLRAFIAKGSSVPSARHRARPPPPQREREGERGREEERVCEREIDREIEGERESESDHFRAAPEQSQRPDSERERNNLNRGNNLKSFQEFCQKARAIIWP